MLLLQYSNVMLLDSSTVDIIGANHDQPQEHTSITLQNLFQPWVPHTLLSRLALSNHTGSWSQTRGMCVSRFYARNKQKIDQQKNQKWATLLQTKQRKIKHHVQLCSTFSRFYASTTRKQDPKFRITKQPRTKHMCYIKKCIIPCL